MLAGAGALIANQVSGLPAAPFILVLALAAAVLFPTARLTPGARYAGSSVLRAGVMLLGAQLSIDALVNHGIGSIGWIVAAVAGVFAFTWWLGSLLAVSPALRILLAAGIAICGNSAVAAIGPLIRADRSHMAIAIAVVTLSGLIAVFLFPLAGAAMSLPQAQYGLWSGIAIADTGQVMAASLAYGTEATETATVTKLMRNALIGPLMVAVAAASSWRDVARHGEAARIRLRDSIPPFVIGFIGLAALRTLEVLPVSLAATLAGVGGFAILVGLAGIGMTAQPVALWRARRGSLPVSLAVILGLWASSLGLLLILR